MTNEEYQETQKAIIEIGQKTTSLNIIGFLQAINQAQTIAPITDPTLYQKAMNNLEAIKHLAQAIQQVNIDYNRVVTAAFQTAISEKQKELNQ